MAFDLQELLEANRGRNFDLHRDHLNHQMVRVLQLTGSDRFYESAHGAHLVDDQGLDYLDFLSGFGVFALGRNHPVIARAVHDAITIDAPHLVQLDCSLPSGLLAEALCARAGKGIERCFFTNSGAESVETAIKFARRHTGRSRILYCDHAFHGLTTGSLALNGSREFRTGFGTLIPSTQIPYDDLDALETELAKGDVAAFVFEPIQGKTVHVSPVESLREIRSLCTAHGALMVTDEVQTGLARTGAFFCHQHADVVPDIITCAKALSGGLVPVGAVLTTDAIWRSTYAAVTDAMVHSSTFAQNTLAMVAGLATLSVFDDTDIIAATRRAGDALTRGITELAERHPEIVDVRGRGLMIGIEFDRRRGTRGRGTFRALETVRQGLFAQLVVEPLFNEHRIISQVAADDVNIIKLLPPLIIDDADIERFLTSFDASLTQASHVGRASARLGWNFAKRGLRTGATRN